MGKIKIDLENSGLIQKLTKMRAKAEMDKIKQFIEQWKEDEPGIKRAFTAIVDRIVRMDNISIEFNARPGITYSLRPRHNAQKKRSLFAMVDVIDDDPEARWLSICFYGEMISDPEDMGDLIPGGLLGEDGYCFDLDEYDDNKVDYIKKRLDEAYESAKSEPTAMNTISH